MKYDPVAGKKRGECNDFSEGCWQIRVYAPIPLEDVTYLYDQGFSQETSDAVRAMRSCQRKRAYKSKAKAKRKANLLPKKGGRRPHPYLCKRCEEWHVGRSRS